MCALVNIVVHCDEMIGNEEWDALASFSRSVAVVRKESARAPRGKKVLMFFVRTSFFVVMRFLREAFT
jgi:hypothetical protein